MSILTFSVLTNTKSKPLTSCFLNVKYVLLVEDVGVITMGTSKITYSYSYLNQSHPLWCKLLRHKGLKRIVGLTLDVIDKNLLVTDVVLGSLPDCVGFLVNDVITEIDNVVLLEFDDNPISLVTHDSIFKINRGGDELSLRLLPFKSLNEKKLGRRGVDSVADLDATDRCSFGVGDRNGVDAMNIIGEDRPLGIFVNRNGVHAMNINGGDRLLIFYMDWCRFSDRLNLPVLQNELLLIFKQHNIKCSVLLVNGDTSVEFVKKYKVQGYPEILFEDKHGKIYTYNSKRSTTNIAQFVINILNNKSK
jgi:hypothetical protein